MAFGQWAVTISLLQKDPLAKILASYDAELVAEVAAGLGVGRAEGAIPIAVYPPVVE